MPLLMVLGVIACKGLVSLIAGRTFHYNGSQTVMMWSLAMPQVAATLATAFIGYEAGLLDRTVLNAVLAMMVVTATLGPLLTARSVRQLVEPTRQRDATPLSDAPSAIGDDTSLTVARRPLNIVVPIANPSTEQGLLDIASRLLSGGAETQGRLLPLALVCPSLEEARGGVNHAVASARERLAQRQ